MGLRQRLVTFIRRPVVFPVLAIVDCSLGGEEAVLFQLVQYRIERAGAEMIAVPPQFLDHVQAEYAFFGSVVQNVDADEAQKQVSEYFLVICRLHKPVYYCGRERLSTSFRV